MGNIVWLASYPKSGNTWLRACIANYLHDGERPLPYRGARGPVMVNTHNMMGRYGDQPLHNLGVTPAAATRGVSSGSAAAADGARA